MFEIGGVPESKPVGDLFDGQVGMEKRSFGLQDDPFLDQRGGSCVLMSQIRTGAGRSRPWHVN
jgi:hypothetical protein